MTILYHLGEKKLMSNEKKVMRIGELKNYPEEFGDNCVLKEISMPMAVKRFRRYVDDAHAQIAGTAEEVQNAICKSCITPKLKNLDKMQLLNQKK